jgi:hypothetical protein
MTEIHRGPDGEAPVPVSAAAAGLVDANEDMQSSLLRLAGRDEPELVIAAEGASPADSVVVRRDGFKTLPGLAPAMKGGDPEELRLGR